MAGDNAEVVAQGIDSLPSGDIAWRIVEDTAETVGAAGYEERALGFAIATEDALLLTDEVTGARTRLASGEAAFTAEGTVQRRESLGAADTSYLRIGLVPAAEASNPNGDTLVFAGDAFAAPTGDREIELIAAKLEDGESTAVRASNPALIIVLSGAATIGNSDLAAGDATILDGTFDIEAGEDGTRVLVAMIGAEIPASPSSPSADASPVATQVPVSDDDDSSVNSSRIIVLTELCPAGVTIEQAQDTSNGDPCFAGEAVTAMTVTVTNLETGESVASGVDPANASAYFPDLPAGPYQVVLDSGAELGHTVGFCGGQDRSADLTQVAFDASVVNLDLPEDREYLCVTRTVQLGGDAGSSEPTNTGTIEASFYACPAGVTFATLYSPDCTLITDGFDFGFQGDTELHLADASFDGSAFTWSGLTINQDISSGVSYSNMVYAYPAGYDWFAFTTDGTLIQEPHAGGFSLTPDRPSAALVVYFISK